MLVSLWNLSDTSTALLSSHLPNFRAIGKFQPPILHLGDFARAYNSWVRTAKLTIGDGNLSGLTVPKGSQRSIISYEIHFCTDQVKTHREVRFWFDLSYNAMEVHGQMLRIKFCSFLFVFCRKSVALRPCLQNGGTQNMWHHGYGVLWRRHDMRT